MKKVTVQQPHNNYPTTEIRAERAMMVKPLIIREYFDRDGVRMYKTFPGGPYLADVYDKMFKPAVKLEIKKEHGKRNSVDPTNNWMAD